MSEHYPRADGPVGSVLCSCGAYQYDGWTFPDQGLPPDFWQHAATTDEPGLRAALAAVESRHRRGDWTEEGWIGNSVDGLECNGCGEEWPCSATRLRLATTPAASDGSLDALRALEAKATPGPWDSSDHREWLYGTSGRQRFQVLPLYPGSSEEQHNTDVDFIVACVEYVRARLSESPSEGKTE